MAEHVYSAADLTILYLPELVWKRPGMFFGIGPGDPRLATRVLCKVVIGAFHPATRIAAGHTPHVVADITADLAFAVTDDQAQIDPSGNAVLGYEKSMLTPERWLSAAAASVSTRTVVEVWQDGRGFRQTLAGLRPVEPPQAFHAPTGAGTRVAFILDPHFVGAATIATDLTDLDLHGPDCSDAAGPGDVLIRDHRSGERPAEYRY